MTPRRRRLLVLTFLTAVACQERLADSDEVEGTVWCSPLVGALILDEKGNTVAAIFDENGEMLFVCHCLPYEEGLSGEWNSTVNDEAYDLCVAHATRMGYPDPANNTCDEQHAKNAWGDVFHVLPHDQDEICDINGSQPRGCAAG